MMGTSRAIAVALMLTAALGAGGCSVAERATNDDARMTQADTLDDTRLVYPGGIDRTVHLAKYKDNKRAAFSFTFYGGRRRHVADIVETVNPLGIRGTFFLIPLLMEDQASAPGRLSWQEARELMAAGHEIGTYGDFKERLHEATDERLDVLVNESWRLIAENTGIEPVTYAIPTESKDEDRVVAAIRQHHYFICHPKYSPGMRFLYCGTRGERLWTQERAVEQIRTSERNGRWIVAIVHAIVDGYSSFQSREEFRTFCQWVMDQEHLWVAPVGEVGRYVRARAVSVLRVVETGEGTVRFTLTCGLEPEELFSVPLTVVIPAPGATDVKVAISRGNAPEARVEGSSILVNAIPDGRTITVTWNGGEGL